MIKWGSLAYCRIPISEVVWCAVQRMRVWIERLRVPAGGPRRIQKRRRRSDRQNRRLVADPTWAVSSRVPRVGPVRECSCLLYEVGRASARRLVQVLVALHRGLLVGRWRLAGHAVEQPPVVPALLHQLPEVLEICGHHHKHPHRWHHIPHIRLGLRLHSRTANHRLRTLAHSRYSETGNFSHLSKEFSFQEDSMNHNPQISMWDHHPNEIIASSSVRVRLWMELPRSKQLAMLVINLSWEEQSSREVALINSHSQHPQFWTTFTKVPGVNTEEIFPRLSLKKTS